MKKLIALATILLAPALASAEGKATAMNDGNIVAIVTTAHQGEIDASQVVLGKTANPDVKKFANMMVTEHSAALDKTRGLGIAAEDSEESKKMQADASANADKLRALTAGEVDKVYIDMMVTDHKKVLEALDKKLIPGAKNSALKQALKDFRPKVADHLKQAETLQKKTTAPVTY